jgi:phosphoribosylaminoimidazole (AIR) synthetase
MRRTFNMGVGMIMVVDPGQVSEVQKVAPEAWVLGEVVKGEGVKYV